MCVGPDLPDVETLECIVDAERPRIDAGPERRRYPPVKDPTQRMASLLVHGDHHVGVGGILAHPGQKRRGEEGHVAGHDEHAAGGRGLERGIDAAERAGILDQIPHATDSWQIRMPAVAIDEHQVWCQRPEHVELTIEDRSATHHEFPFVGATHAAAGAATEDGGRNWLTGGHRFTSHYL